MRPSLRLPLALLVLGLMLGAGVFGVMAETSQHHIAQDQVRSELQALPFPPYAHQKVVYEVDDGGGWFGRGYRDILGSLRNHVAAVGERNIDLRVVLHGPGLGLLRHPNEGLRLQIDALRQKGVKFVICRNSLIDSATEPQTLYGVASSDIVPAAVAEIAALQGKGFVYLHL